jgi:CheY-like chemotaxis protein
MDKNLSRTGRTVLLVDDDPMLRELTVECLESAGHTVVTASSADEALRLAPFLPALDLLLSDLVMPGLDPRVLAGRLREGRPGLPVVFMSGQVDGSLPALEGGCHFLPKPFTPAQVRQTVEQALQEG